MLNPNFARTLLSILAAASLVACGGGGDGFKLTVPPPPDTTNAGVVTNDVTPAVDTSVTAGQSLSIQARALATQAPITSHKWAITQIGGVTAGAASMPALTDAGCAGASVTAGALPSTALPLGKDARSVCQTVIAIPLSTPTSQWLVSNVASTGAASAARQFVLNVSAAPANASPGLVLSVPALPQIFTIDQPASIAAAYSLGEGITLSAPVSYVWTQVSGASVALAGSSTAMVSFIPRSVGDYSFKVTASATANGHTETREASVVVAVAAANIVVTGLTLNVPLTPQVFTADLPASFAATYTLNPGTVLDAPVTYAWTQVSGTAVAMAGTSAATLSFIPHTPGDYVFKVTTTATSKGHTDTREASVVASVKSPMTVRPGLVLNVPLVPLAFTAEQTASFVSTYTLSPGVVLDTPVTYEWTQVSGPAVALAGSTAATVSFIPHAAGDYVFKVKASATANALTETREATVAASVQAVSASSTGLTLNAPTLPQFFTTDQTASLAVTTTTSSGVTLDSPVSYEWTQVAGTSVVMAATNTATVSFIPRAAGDYAFKVKASGTLNGYTDTREATMVASVQAPGVGVIGLAVSVPLVPQVFALNTTAMVTAAYSLNPGIVLDGPVTFEWTQASGTAVSLAASNTATVSFIPRTAEDYTLKVKVTATSGGRSETKTSAIVVSVPSALTGPVFVVSAGDAQIVASTIPVVLKGTVAVGTPAPGNLTYQWTQLSGPLVMLANAETLTASFVAPATGTYAFELAVTSSDRTQRTLTTVQVLSPP